MTTDCNDQELVDLLSKIYGSNSSALRLDGDVIRNGCQSQIQVGLDEDFGDYPSGSAQSASPSGGERLYAIATPFILVIGLVGNLVSLRVFSSSPRMRRLSASLYLSAVSVSDCLVLTTYVLLEWFNRGLPVWPGQHRIRLVDTRGVCEIFLFMSYTCRFVSIWVIVMFTIERYIAVCRPFRRRAVCTRKFARRAIGLIVLTASLVSFHKPLLSGVYTVRPSSVASSMTSASSSAAAAAAVAKIEKLMAQMLTARPDAAFQDGYGETASNDNWFVSAFDPAEGNRSSAKSDDNVTITAPEMSLLDWPGGGSDDDLDQRHYPRSHDRDDDIPDEVEGTRVCRRNPDYDGSYVSFITELIYGLSITAVPFVPIAIFNVAILKALLTRDAVSRALTNQTSAAPDKRVRREFTVLLLVVSASIVCLSMPYFVIWCHQFFQSRNPDGPAMAHWIRDKLLATKTIFYINYAINFILYSVAGANYRDSVVAMFRRPCPCLPCRPTAGLNVGRCNGPQSGGLALHRIASSTITSSVRASEYKRVTNV